MWHKNVRKEKKTDKVYFAGYEIDGEREEEGNRRKNKKSEK